MNPIPPEVSQERVNEAEQLLSDLLMSYMKI